MALGAPRTSNPPARSAKPGGGSIPLAPSNISLSFGSLAAVRAGLVEACAWRQETASDAGKRMSAHLFSHHVTVGVAGHVDHGKTSLVKALTGVDTDRLAEEKRRGLSIESGIAPCALADGARISLVDVPGHTDFLKNTIRGLSCVDVAILVVAADDGVMPQTREHLEILEHLGVQEGFVVLSKADLVDLETLMLAELEIREAVAGTFLGGKAIHRFSAVDRRGLAGIRDALEQAVGRLQQDRSGEPFRLWIDRVRSFPGHGTVVSGTVRSGRLRRNDPVVVFPFGRESRVRSLEIHHTEVSEAAAGERVGINLHRVPLREVRRGMLLAAPASFSPEWMLNADFRVSPRHGRGLRNRQKVKLCVGTAVIQATAVLMETDRVEAGIRGLVQFRLKEAVAVLPGDPVVACLMDRPEVIGGGRILETTREKFRAKKARQMTAYLKALQNRDIEAFLDHLYAGPGERFVTLNGLVRVSGFSPADIRQAVEGRVAMGRLVLLEDGGVLHADLYDRLKRRIPQIVDVSFESEPHRKHVKAAEIRRKAAPALEERAFEEILAELCREGILTKVGSGYHRGGFSATLKAAERRLLQEILHYARQTAKTPFSADTLWKDLGKKYGKQDIQDLMERLTEQGVFARLRDGRFLSLNALESIKRKVRDVIETKGAFSLSDIRDTLGCGRRIGVMILEYLDSTGFTERTDGGRRLRA